MHGPSQRAQPRAPRQSARLSFRLRLWSMRPEQQLADQEIEQYHVQAMKHQVGQMISQRIESRSGVDQRIAQPAQRLIAHDVAYVGEHPPQPVRIQTPDERVSGDAKFIIPRYEVRLQHPAEDPERDEQQQSDGKQMAAHRTRHIQSLKTY